jgi:hypothetical protein
LSRSQARSRLSQRALVRGFEQHMSCAACLAAID